ncbi:GNAT family N-acetyltransferase [Amnibacterium flavum]|uniref:GNAT family N-acetyltransferase n=1 Tax=Amnibacterium flavum TaxID=2173173 RepID=A0A2V1HSW2_9MICO|nr:GNAT family protein [Amnibacterium flavum]PVZ95658.1 GNAT family N-acetyltransferase [Amnibacterium flavum]
MSDPVTVVTERLTLRPVETTDRAALLAYRSLPEVCRYLPFPPMDAAEVDRRITEQWSTTVLAAPGDARTLAIVETSSGRLVGDVVLFWSAGAERQGEIGYVLSPEATGRGYATEAAVAMLAVAFDSLGLHRVIGRLDPRNTASARVLERLGMRREADFVEDFFADGEWSDTAVYAILDREWRAAHPSD